MADVIAEVLEEKHDHIKAALDELAENEPLVFLRLIAMPRMQRLQRQQAAAAKTARTAAEAEIERQMMSEATDAAQKELDEFMHVKPNSTTPIAISG